MKVGGNKTAKWIESSTKKIAVVRGHRCLLLIEFHEGDFIDEDMEDLVAVI